MDYIHEMYKALDKVRNETRNMPDKAFARQSFLDSIGRQIGMTTRDGKPQTGMNAFAGMPVHLTENLPQGVLCMLVDKDMKPLHMIVDSTYKPASETTAHMKG